MICFLGIQHSVPSNGIVWTKRYTYHHSQWLPSGLVLLSESGYYFIGNLDRVRLTWYRPEGSRFKKLRTFQGMMTLDDMPPKVWGNRVSMTTVDNALAFQPCAADDSFSRLTTWDVEGGRLRLLSRTVLNQRLRAVDAAIYCSWSAKHPTSLQKQLRKAWPEPDDLGNWTETRNGSTWTLSVDHEYIFTLRPTASGGWKVVQFSDHQKPS